MTLAVRKRLSGTQQLQASWTWSHAIDDATDIQTFEEPQDNSNARLDRGNSNFDQRHRLVLTGVFDSHWNSLDSAVARSFLTNWTFAPRLEVGSGRPYRLLTRTDRSLVNSSSTARPSVVPIGTSGSFASPDGKVGLALPQLGAVGNLGRNAYRTTSYQALDFRLTRRFQFSENLCTRGGDEICRRGGTGDIGVSRRIHRHRVDWGRERRRVDEHWVDDQPEVLVVTCYVKRYLPAADLIPTCYLLSGPAICW